MEPNTSTHVDIKSEDGVNGLIPKLKNIGRDGTAEVKEEFRDAVIVIFDLDLTNSQSREKEICQIAAQCYGQNGHKFTQYILPYRQITRNSTKYHGIKIGLSGDQKKLYHNENPVDAVSPKEGLKLFLDFLENQTGRVILAAQNSKRKDSLTIIRQMRNYLLIEQFESVVLGFTDTISVFKTLLPERIEQDKSFSIDVLITDYLGENRNPPNCDAVYIVESLVLLLRTHGCTNENMIQHVQLLDTISPPEDVAERLVYLEFLDDAITKSMKEKIARAGITMGNLVCAFYADGGNGVKDVLRRGRDGNPVINDERKINSIITKLAELVETPFDDNNVYDSN